MALDLSEEKRKVEAIESEIELEADRLQKDGMRSKEADAKARETILENHDQAIDDSIAILKGELASIGTGRDKELVGARRRLQCRATLHPIEHQRQSGRPTSARSRPPQRAPWERSRLLAAPEPWSDRVQEAEGAEGW